MNAMPAPLRRAALVLHALTEADRQWLLTELPPTQTQPLRALLAELNDLGLPPDPLLALDAIGWDASAPPGGKPPTAAEAPTAAPTDQQPAQSEAAPASAGAALARIAPGQIAHLLRDEPDRLLALLLQPEAPAWPWQQTVLRHLGTERAERVRAAPPMATAAASLRGQVLAQLWQRCADLPPVQRLAQAPPAPSPAVPAQALASESEALRATPPRPDTARPALQRAPTHATPRNPPHTASHTAPRAMVGRPLLHRLLPWTR